MINTTILIIYYIHFYENDKSKTEVFVFSFLIFLVRSFFFFFFPTELVQNNIVTI